MNKDLVWSNLFAVAIAILMLAVLLTRSGTPALWVLILYPSIGAGLALIASRTSPNPQDIAWIQTGTIAAACIVLLAALVNVLLLELVVRKLSGGATASDGLWRNVDYVVLPVISALLWWALERRLSRLRAAPQKRAKDITVREELAGDNPTRSAPRPTSRDKAAGRAQTSRAA